MGTVKLRRVRGCGFALAVWLSATGALGTCNFFKPAVPEKPSRAPIIGSRFAAGRERFDGRATRVGSSGSCSAAS